jgi:signal transduction histidine kinase
VSSGTIRFQITALASVAVGVVLVVAGVGLVLAQRAQLVGGLDASLRQRAADVEILVEREGTPDVIAGSEDSFVQLVTPDGIVITATDDLEGLDPLPVPQPAAGSVLSTVDLPLVDEDRFRVLTTPVDTDQGPATLHVGSSLDDMAESVGILAFSLTVTIPVTVLLLAGVVWWLVGRTLAPVEAIRSEVATIGFTDLDRRVPRPPGNDEIARLAETMNEMLDRLHDSVARRQAFVADASHELRSPLTRMRSALEVELARIPEGEVTFALASVLEEVIGLQSLVENLLHLARSDAGQVPIRVEPVDLDDLLLEEARRIRAGTRVEVDMSAVSAAQIVGDRHQLGRAIHNLVDNAEQHASEQVWLALSERGGEAVLTVDDDGPGIPQEQRERIFERFTRLDPARTHQGGTGLGLAIARDIVERYGGTVSVGTSEAGGARFVVRLPLGAS